MRKHKLPRELAELASQELDEVHTWLKKYPYERVRELCASRFDIQIGVSKLCRYYQRLQDLENYNKEAAQPLTMGEFLAVQNGQPLPDGRINKQLLQLQCFRLAQRKGLTPEQLLQLLNVTTYDQRSGFAERRLALAGQLLDLRKLRAALREEEAALRKTDTSGESYENK